MSSAFIIAVPATPSVPAPSVSPPAATAPSVTPTSATPSATVSTAPTPVLVTNPKPDTGDLIVALLPVRVTVLLIIAVFYIRGKAESVSRRNSLHEELVRLKDESQRLAALAGPTSPLIFNPALTTEAWDAARNTAPRGTLSSSERTNLGELYSRVNNANSLQGLVPQLLLLSASGTGNGAAAYMEEAKRFATAPYIEVARLAEHAERNFRVIRNRRDRIGKFFDRWGAEDWGTP
jgi:hypothetical protein